MRGEKNERRKEREEKRMRGEKSERRRKEL